MIGRETEIDRLIQILGRRKKNNPILIGEAGVGKSAIVEGLALAHRFARRTAVTLRQACLFARCGVAGGGTKYRGQFEERVKEFMEGLEKREGCHSLH